MHIIDPFAFIISEHIHYDMLNMQSVRVMTTICLIQKHAAFMLYMFNMLTYSI